MAVSAVGQLVVVPVLRCLGRLTCTLYSYLATAARPAPPPHQTRLHSAESHRCPVGISLRLNTWSAHRALQHISNIIITLEVV